MQSLASFLALPGDALARGPIAVILIEDSVEVASTLAHHIRAGFRKILALSPEPLTAADLPDDPKDRIVNLIHDTRRGGAHVGVVNALIDAAPPDTWMYYGYNAEYLFYPFSETRGVGEMLAFHTEERRRAMLTYVIDLYTPDLSRYPDAVSLDEAAFDGTGYYALGRPDRQGGVKERQLDFYGGLRWRFEEHLPPDRRRIDRIALFRTQPKLRLLPDHRFDVEEYNTYACPWHHNLTAAIASFRVAKALARNPASRDQVRGFGWNNSMPFRWTSQQLLDLGLMEPGQWF
ncbi:glycosyltransferase family 2 protein [Paracoccus sp. Z118]|nr:glycosyltransferase family 2 protein [Paracoccus sp. Z118]